MLVSDLTVEVRDVNMVRRGVIHPDFLNLKATLRYLGVGEWEVSLPADDPMAVVLGQDGAGIVVTHRTLGVVFSGPRKVPTQEATAVDPVGVVSFSGVTDSVLLWQRRTYPRPSSADIGAQTVAYDVRSGAAETVMREYVNVNLGPGAPGGRRAQGLGFDVNGGRGGTTKRSTRMEVLGELLATIAASAGLGFDIVQDLAAPGGVGLKYRTLVPVDRRAFVRLDVANGTLASTKTERTGFDHTHVIVAGQGEGAARTLIERSSAESRAWAARWGTWGRVEGFKDQRQTDDVVELQQAGDEFIAEGAESLAVTAVAPDDVTMRYLVDWNLGDFLKVVVNGVEGSAQATSVELRIDRDGVRLGLGVGEVVGWNPTAQTVKRLDQTQARLDALERTAEVPSTWPASAISSGVFDAARIPRALDGLDLPIAQPVSFAGTGGSAVSGLRRVEDGALTGSVELYGASVRLVQQPYAGSLQGAALRVIANGIIDHNAGGGSFNPYPHADAVGFVDITVSNASAATTTVAFPAGRFDFAPVVEVSRNNGAVPRMMAYATSITATGCTIGVISSDGAAYTGTARVGWTARQMRPTATIG